MVSLKRILSNISLFVPILFCFCFIYFHFISKPIDPLHTYRQFQRYKVVSSELNAGMVVANPAVLCMI